jgi:transcriptional regulator with XRE-family HTH domain
MASKRRGKNRVHFTSGKSLQIIREVQNFSRHELARAAGVPLSLIDAIESDQAHLGVELARKLARPLQCHPSLLVYPFSESER